MIAHDCMTARPIFLFSSTFPPATELPALLPSLLIKRREPVLFFLRVVLVENEHFIQQPELTSTRKPGLVIFARCFIRAPQLLLFAIGQLNTSIPLILIFILLVRLVVRLPILFL